MKKVIVTQKGGFGFHDKQPNDLDHVEFRSVQYEEIVEIIDDEFAEKMVAAGKASYDLSILEPKVEEEEVQKKDVLPEDNPDNVVDEDTDGTEISTLGEPPQKKQKGKSKKKGKRR